jgi:hypothetical protein
MRANASITDRRRTPDHICTPTGDTLVTRQ